MEAPIYVPEDEVSPGAFLKKLSALGLGGWWLGGTHMKPNKEFMKEVTSKIPKDAKVVVTCQKGLRYGLGCCCTSCFSSIVSSLS